MVDKYQGAVPQGASVERFRKTGMTMTKEKGKYILYKDKNRNKDEKKSKGKLNIKKLVKGKLASRDIVKSNKVTLKIKEKEIPSVLNDENRFFNSEMKQAKKEMFFT